MTTHKGLMIAALALLLAPGGATALVPSGAPETAATTPSAEPKTERLTVEAPSLDGNLLGDPSEIEIEVQTPASYATSPGRRYPVVYFLAGYDEGASVVPIGLELQRLLAAGRATDLILVGISGDNALGGSFYVDSPVSGRWAAAIVDDVVVMVDDHYRTPLARSP